MIPKNCCTKWWQKLITQSFGTSDEKMMTQSDDSKLFTQIDVTKGWHYLMTHVDEKNNDEKCCS